MELILIVVGIILGGRYLLKYLHKLEDEDRLNSIKTFADNEVYDIVEIYRRPSVKPGTQAEYPPQHNFSEEPTPPPFPFTIIVGKPPSRSERETPIIKKRPFKVFEDTRKYTLWNDPLLQFQSNNRSKLQIDSIRNTSVVRYDPHVMASSLNLVYKWFGLLENGKLNYRNPIHIGALAIAREMVIRNENFMSVEVPYNLQELSDAIINRARKYLRIQPSDDVDYRIFSHFKAVSIATQEVLQEIESL